ERGDGGLGEQLENLQLGEIAGQLGGLRRQEGAPADRAAVPRVRRRTPVGGAQAVTHQTAGAQVFRRIGRHVHPALRTLPGIVHWQTSFRLSFRLYTEAKAGEGYKEGAFFQGPRAANRSRISSSTWAGSSSVWAISSRSSSR